MSAGLINAMLTDAPSALWPMTDPTPPSGAGTFTDVSGNARHLTLNTSAVPLQATRVIPGAPKVWDPTDGSAHYASLANAAWMTPGAGDWCISFFYRGTGLSGINNSFNTPYGVDAGDTGNGTLVYVSNKGAGGWPRGSLRVWYAGTVFQNALANQNNVSLVDGASHHIWVEKRSGTVSLFVDGYAGVSGAAGTPSSMTGTLWVGRSDGGTSTYYQYDATGYMGVWSGGATIPSAARRAVYLSEARRSGVVY